MSDSAGRSFLACWSEESYTLAGFGSAGNGKVPRKRQGHFLLPADDGTRYRVYDTTFSKRKHHMRPIGDPTATARVFVPKHGMKRSYTFRPGESRILEDQAVERQLRAADK